MIKPHTQSEEPVEETEKAAGVPDEGTDEGPSRIADLEKQLAEMKDRALREMADAENTRRRAQKEREEISKYAVTNFAKEMLDIADNFRRALAAAPENVVDPAVKNLITGIDATERQFQAALERFGIKMMEPVGQAFDPHFHRVMNEVDSDKYPAGTIVQVLQAGYMIHDRLLREALVAVARGPNGAQHIDTSA